MIVPETLTPLVPRAVTDAAARIAGSVIRTPLVRLGVEAETEIWLKLESLQPIGSFKLRGAINAVRSLPSSALVAGVHTTSAGNFAQGLAWAAREAGVPCVVYAPDHAPTTKLDAIRRLDATVHLVPFAQWWDWLTRHFVDGAVGTYIHPGADPAVMAGNGTIALEILEQLPDVDTILAPYGSGGLACGIACGITAHRATRRHVRVRPVELEGRAPFSAARAARGPVTIPYTANFIDAMGGTTVLAEMWPLADALLGDPLVVSFAGVVDAVRLLAERNRIIAEGAGAAPVGAALAHDAELRGQRVVCVVSGGNIEGSVLTSILGGTAPS